MIKEYLYNKKIFTTIMKSLIVESNSPYNTIINVNFQFKFDDLELNIWHKDNCVNFTYNLYTEEIKFDSASISLNKNSIYYKKLKYYMKHVAIKVVELDEFHKEMNKYKEKLDEFFKENMWSMPYLSQRLPATYEEKVNQLKQLPKLII